MKDFVLVPVTPTQEMLHAGAGAACSTTALLDNARYSCERACWKAMLEKAPATRPDTFPDPQPIETAPKDTAILVWAGGWDKAHFNTAYNKWIGYGENTADTHNMNSFNKPTLWMPLPPFPAVETK